jgi:hypothetical protein
MQVRNRSEPKGSVNPENEVKGKRRCGSKNKESQDIAEAFQETYKQEFGKFQNVILDTVRNSYIEMGNLSCASHAKDLEFAT